MDTKKKILVYAVVIAAAAAFILTYRRETTQEYEQPPIVSAEVKGGEIGSAQTGTYNDQEAVRRLDLTTENIIWFTNYYRSLDQLPPLAASAQLKSSATSKALDMIQYQYFDHVRPGNGISFDRFIDAQQYEFIKVGENLAMGDFRTSREVVDAWMQSPSHRKNILDPAYTEIGIAVTEGHYHDRQVTVIVQHFGTPSKSCPTVSAGLRDQIHDQEITIKEFEESLTGKQEAIDHADDDTSDQQIIDHLIQEYNQLVDQYNAAVKEMEILVGKYNDQVKRFDGCVKKKL